MFTVVREDCLATMVFDAMDFPAPAQYWVNLVLLWIGFGTVVGLIAKAFLPEGEPSSLFSVLVLGITGSCLGPVLVSQLRKPDHFHPITPLGILVSILAAFFLMLSYRLLCGFFRRNE